MDRYVETGSIGLDAKAFCGECDGPLIKNGDDYVRSCRHHDAEIVLKDVMTREYSYVAEPAYEHTIALPTFGAAVSNELRRSSSLTRNQSNNGHMTEDKLIKVQAKKAQEDEEEKTPEQSQDEEVEKQVALYKRGFDDAVKAMKGMEEPMPEKEVEGQEDVKKEEVVAKAQEEEEKKEDAEKHVQPELEDAKASRKTDQITVQNPKVETSQPEVDGAKMLRAAWGGNDKDNMEPWMKELFHAASTGPSTPKELMAKQKGAFE